MNDRQLSLTEYAVLGLLVERPTHGFAMSKELAMNGPLGRVLTVRRPLVYRALDRLVALAFAEPMHTEPGNAGPKRVIHRATPAGRRRLKRWLGQPVQHVRDMRIDFQLKLSLLERLGRSQLELILAQRVALDPTLAALDWARTDAPDHVELWRRHNAAAAETYLNHLERMFRGNEVS